MSHTAKRREILSHQRFQLWVKSLYASLYTAFFTAHDSAIFLTCSGNLVNTSRFYDASDSESGAWLLLLNAK
ncbi:MAG: hypothetical protein WDM70_07940 [Nitrosomonadales bacterium]